MWEDEILNEIHKIREEHAKSFNHDLNLGQVQKWSFASGKAPGFELDLVQS